MAKRILIVDNAPDLRKPVQAEASKAKVAELLNRWHASQLERAE
jgi:hypothetical protein